MRKKSYLLRAVSSLLIGIFLWADSGVAWAISDLYAAAKPSDAALLQIKLPEQFASVQKIYRGTQPQTIIHLQDAHANSGAQLNLAGALEHLIRNYGVRTVFVEGGTRDNSLTPLRAYADPAVRERVARKYLLRGELSGEEYLSLAGDLDFKIIGVEDRDLYFKDLSAYERAAKFREEAQLYLNRLLARVEALKRAHYSSEMTALDQARQRFTRGDISYTEYYDVLAGEAGRLHVALAGYPQIMSLEKMRQAENGVDFEKADQQLRRLLSGAAGFTESLSRLRNGSLMDHKELSDAVRKKIVSGDAGTAEAGDLKRYCEYLDLFNTISPGSLLEELHGLESELFQKGLQTETSFRLWRADAYLTLLRDLIRLQISSASNRQLASFRNDETFETIKLIGFVNRETIRLNQFEAVLPYEDVLDKARAAAEEFYETARNRDDIFVEKTLQRMYGDDSRVAVLITGGYHTENLTAILRAKGVSYLTAVPNVNSETNLRRYESILLNQTPLGGSAAGSADTLRFLGAAERVNSPWQAIIDDLTHALPPVAAARLASVPSQQDSKEIVGQSWARAEVEKWLSKTFDLTKAEVRNISKRIPKKTRVRIERVRNSVDPNRYYVVISKLGSRGRGFERFAVYEASRGGSQEGFHLEPVKFRGRLYRAADRERSTGMPRYQIIWPRNRDLPPFVVRVFNREIIVNDLRDGHLLTREPLDAVEILNGDFEWSRMRFTLARRRRSELFLVATYISQGDEVLPVSEVEIALGRSTLLSQFQVRIAQAILTRVLRFLDAVSRIGALGETDTKDKRNEEGDLQRSAVEYTGADHISGRAASAFLRGLSLRDLRRLINIRQLAKKLEPHGLDVAVRGDDSIQIRRMNVDKRLAVFWISRNLPQVLNEMGYEKGSSLDVRKSKSILFVNAEGALFPKEYEGATHPLSYSAAHQPMIEYLRKGGVVVILTNGDSQQIKSRLLADDALPPDARRNILLVADGASSMHTIGSDDELHEIREYRWNALKQLETENFPRQINPNSLDALWIGYDYTGGSTQTVSEFFAPERTISVSNKPARQHALPLRAGYIGHGDYGFAALLKSLNSLLTGIDGKRSADTAVFSNDNIVKLAETARREAQALSKAEGALRDQLAAETQDIIHRLTRYPTIGIFTNTVSWTENRAIAENWSREARRLSKPVNVVLINTSMPRAGDFIRRDSSGTVQLTAAEVLFQTDNRFHRVLMPHQPFTVDYVYGEYPGILYSQKQGTNTLPTTASRESRILETDKEVQLWLAASAGLAAKQVLMAVDFGAITKAVPSDNDYRYEELDVSIEPDREDPEYLERVSKYVSDHLTRAVKAQGIHKVFVQPQNSSWAKYSAAYDLDNEEDVDHLSHYLYEMTKPVFTHNSVPTVHRRVLVEPYYETVTVTAEDGTVQKSHARCIVTRALTGSADYEVDPIRIGLLNQKSGSVPGLRPDVIGTVFNWPETGGRLKLSEFYRKVPKYFASEVAQQAFEARLRQTAAAFAAKADLEGYRSDIRAVDFLIAEETEEIATDHGTVVIPKIIFLESASHFAGEEAWGKLTGDPGSYRRNLFYLASELARAHFVQLKPELKDGARLARWNPQLPNIVVFATEHSFTERSRLAENWTLLNESIGNPVNVILSLGGEPEFRDGHLFIEHGMQFHALTGLWESLKTPNKIEVHYAYGNYRSPQGLQTPVYSTEEAQKFSSNKVDQIDLALRLGIPTKNVLHELWFDSEGDRSQTDEENVMREALYSAQESGIRRIFIQPSHGTRKALSGIFDISGSEGIEAAISFASKAMARHTNAFQTMLVQEFIPSFPLKDVTWDWIYDGPDSEAERNFYLHQLMSDQPAGEFPKGDSAFGYHNDIRVMVSRQADGNLAIGPIWVYVSDIVYVDLPLTANPDPNDYAKAHIFADRKVMTLEEFLDKAVEPGKARDLIYSQIYDYTRRLFEGAPAQDGAAVDYIISFERSPEGVIPRVVMTEMADYVSGEAKVDRIMPTRGQMHKSLLRTAIKRASKFHAMSLPSQASRLASFKDLADARGRQWWDSMEDSRKRLLVRFLGAAERGRGRVPTIVVPFDHGDRHYKHDEIPLPEKMLLIARNIDEYADRYLIHPGHMLGRYPVGVDPASVEGIRSFKSLRSLASRDPLEVRQKYGPIQLHPELPTDKIYILKWEGDSTPTGDVTDPGTVSIKAIGNVPTTQAEELRIDPSELTAVKQIIGLKLMTFVDASQPATFDVIMRKIKEESLAVHRAGLLFIPENLPAKSVSGKPLVDVPADSKAAWETQNTLLFAEALKRFKVDYDVYKFPYPGDPQYQSVSEQQSVLKRLHRLTNGRLLMMLSGDNPDTFVEKLVIAGRRVNLAGAIAGGYLWKHSFHDNRTAEEISHDLRTSAKTRFERVRDISLRRPWYAALGITQKAVKEVIAGIGARLGSKAADSDDNKVPGTIGNVKQAMQAVRKLGGFVVTSSQYAYRQIYQNRRIHDWQKRKQAKEEKRIPEVHRALLQKMRDGSVRTLGQLDRGTVSALWRKTGEFRREGDKHTILIGPGLDSSADIVIGRITERTQSLPAKDGLSQIYQITSYDSVTLRRLLESIPAGQRDSVRCIVVGTADAQTKEFVRALTSEIPNLRYESDDTLYNRTTLPLLAAGLVDTTPKRLWLRSIYKGAASKLEKLTALKDSELVEFGPYKMATTLSRFAKTGQNVLVILTYSTVLKAFSTWIAESLNRAMNSAPASAIASGEWATQFWHSTQQAWRQAKGIREKLEVLGFMAIIMIFPYTTKDAQIAGPSNPQYRGFGFRYFLLVAREALRTTIGAMAKRLLLDVDFLADSPENIGAAIQSFQVAVEACGLLMNQGGQEGPVTDLDARIADRLGNGAAAAQPARNLRIRQNILGYDAANKRLNGVLGEYIEENLQSGQFRPLQQTLGTLGILTKRLRSKVLKPYQTRDAKDHLNPDTILKEMKFARAAAELLSDSNGRLGRGQNPIHTVYVCSIGGSTFGAVAANALGLTQGPAIVEATSIDPIEMNRMLVDIRASNEPESIALVVISKSGVTTETDAVFATLYQAVLDRVQKLRKVSESDAKRVVAGQVLVITDAQVGKLRQMVRLEGLRSIDHPPLIGGRWSMFSSVGLIVYFLKGGSYEALQERLLRESADAAWDRQLDKALDRVSRFSAELNSKGLAAASAEELTAKRLAIAGVMDNLSSVPGISEGVLANLLNQVMDRDTEVTIGLSGAYEYLVSHKNPAFAQIGAESLGKPGARYYRLAWFGWNALRNLFNRLARNRRVMVTLFHESEPDDSQGARLSQADQKSYDALLETLGDASVPYVSIETPPMDPAHLVDVMFIEYRRLATLAALYSPMDVGDEGQVGVEQNKKVVLALLLRVAKSVREKIGAAAERVYAALRNKMLKTGIEIPAVTTDEIDTISEAPMDLSRWMITDENDRQGRELAEFLTRALVGPEGLLTERAVEKLRSLPIQAIPGYLENELTKRLDDEKVARLYMDFKKADKERPTAPWVVVCNPIDNHENLLSNSANGFNFQVYRRIHDESDAKKLAWLCDARIVLGSDERLIIANKLQTQDYRLKGPKGRRHWVELDRAGESNRAIFAEVGKTLAPGGLSSERPAGYQRYENEVQRNLSTQYRFSDTEASDFNLILTKQGLWTGWLSWSEAVGMAYASESASGMAMFMSDNGMWHIADNANRALRESESGEGAILNRHEIYVYAGSPQAVRQIQVFMDYLIAPGKEREAVLETLESLDRLSEGLTSEDIKLRSQILAWLLKLKEGIATLPDKALKAGSQTGNLISQIRSRIGSIESKMGADELISRLRDDYIELNLETRREPTIQDDYLLLGYPDALLRYDPAIAEGEAMTLVYKLERYFVRAPQLKLLEMIFTEIQDTHPDIAQDLSDLIEKFRENYRANAKSRRKPVPRKLPEHNYAEGEALSDYTARRAGIPQEVKNRFGLTSDELPAEAQQSIDRLVQVYLEPQVIDNIESDPDLLELRSKRPEIFYEVGGKLHILSLHDIRRWVEDNKYDPEVNASGDVSSLLDSIYNPVLVHFLKPYVSVIISEENKPVVPGTLPRKSSEPGLALFLDPIDGSSQVEVGGVFGMIGALAFLSPEQDLSLPASRKTFNPREQILCSFDMVYGFPRTILRFVNRSDRGQTDRDPSGVVTQFDLLESETEPLEFRVSHDLESLTSLTEDLEFEGLLPTSQSGKALAFAMGGALTEFMEERGHAESMTALMDGFGGHYLSYTGGLVSDIGKLVASDPSKVQGVVHSYAATNAHRHGRFRYWFELLHYALMFDILGGELSDGYAPLLDREPVEPHKEDEPSGAESESIFASRWISKFNFAVRAAYAQWYQEYRNSHRDSAGLAVSPSRSERQIWSAQFVTTYRRLTTAMVRNIADYLPGGDMLQKTHDVREALLNLSGNIYTDGFVSLAQKDPSDPAHAQDYDRALAMLFPRSSGARLTLLDTPSELADVSIRLGTISEPMSIRIPRHFDLQYGDHSLRAELKYSGGYHQALGLSPYIYQLNAGDTMIGNIKITLSFDTQLKVFRIYTARFEIQRDLNRFSAQEWRAFFVWFQETMNQLSGRIWSGSLYLTSLDSPDIMDQEWAVRAVGTERILESERETIAEKLMTLIQSRRRITDNAYRYDPIRYYAVVSLGRLGVATDAILREIRVVFDTTGNRAQRRAAAESYLTLTGYDPLSEKRRPTVSESDADSLLPSLERLPSEIDIKPAKSVADGWKKSLSMFYMFDSELAQWTVSLKASDKIINPYLRAQALESEYDNERRLLDRAFRADNVHLALAVKDGEEPIGFVLTLGNGIEMLYVKPEYRNQGIAAHLFRTALRALLLQQSTILRVRDLSRDGHTGRMAKTFGFEEIADGYYQRDFFPNYLLPGDNDGSRLADADQREQDAFDFMMEQKGKKPAKSPADTKTPETKISETKTPDWPQTQLRNSWGPDSRFTSSNKATTWGPGARLTAYRIARENRRVIQRQGIWPIPIAATADPISSEILNFTSALDGSIRVRSVFADNELIFTRDELVNRNNPELTAQDAMEANLLSRLESGQSAVIMLPMDSVMRGSQLQATEVQQTLERFEKICAARRLDLYLFFSYRGQADESARAQIMRYANNHIHIQWIDTGGRTLIQSAVSQLEQDNISLDSVGVLALGVDLADAADVGYAEAAQNTVLINKLQIFGFEKPDITRQTIISFADLMSAAFTSVTGSNILLSQNIRRRQSAFGWIWVVEPFIDAQLRQVLLGARMAETSA